MLEEDINKECHDTMWLAQAYENGENQIFLSMIIAAMIILARILIGDMR